MKEFLNKTLLSKHKQKSNIFTKCRRLSLSQVTGELLCLIVLEKLSYEDVSYCKYLNSFHVSTFLKYNQTFLQWIGDYLIFFFFFFFFWSSVYTSPKKICPSKILEQNVSHIKLLNFKLKNFMPSHVCRLIFIYLFS